jgi:hypothetical protein
MMSKKVDFIKLLSLIINAILLIVLVVMTLNRPPAAAPLPIPVTGNEVVADTPVPVKETNPANSFVTLLDTTKLELRPGTKIEVVSEASDSKETIVNLLEGEMLVMANPDSLGWLTIQTPKGYTARIQGCTMVVSYSPSSDNFGMDCISGVCELGPSEDKYLAADTGLFIEYQAGKLMFPQPIDEAKLAENFSSDYKQCVLPEPIPVTGGEATLEPDFGATATASCKDFQSKFPATPCP